MREGFEPKYLDVFGSLCTLVERGDLPENLSPDNQNVEYFPGGVKSRVGFTQLGSRSGASGYGFGSLISFMNSSTAVPGRLLLDFAGSLFRETPAGTFTAATGAGAIGANAFMNGVQIEDDVYFALSNGKTPYGRQRRHNVTGNKMRPIAQSGPYDQMVMTYTGGAIDPLPVHAVCVFEMEDGTLSPCSASDYQTSYYDSTAITWTTVPRGPAGTVRRRIYLTTRGGGSADFYTHPYLWINDNTSVSLAVTGATMISDDILRSGFPLPDYCKDSILPPPACGIASFNGRTLLYGLMNMIPHRKADAYIAGLSTGFAPLYAELGPQNCAFDGGQSVDATSTSPSGFSLETMANGFYVANNGDAVGGAFCSGDGQYGSGWKLTGDGVDPSIGQISAVINGSHLAQLTGNQKIRVRVRAKKSASLNSSTALWVALLDSSIGSKVSSFTAASPAVLTTVDDLDSATELIDGDLVLSRGMVNSGAGSMNVAGVFVANLTGTSVTLVGSDTTGSTPVANTGRIDKALGYARVLGSELTTDWAWYDYTVECSDVARIGSVCILMTGGANGIPTAGQSIYVDEYHLYPATRPYLQSSIFASEIDDPNHYRAGICELQVNPKDGQTIRNVFEIRGSCYVAKDSSLWNITDNGLTFDMWDVGNVSPSVGTQSYRGVGVGEGFAIIASKLGCYIFSGGVPEKISDEIRSQWDRINWTYGHLVSVCVDATRQRAYIAAPLDSSAVNSHIFVLDFFQGFASPVPSGGGRKWTLWTLASGYTPYHIDMSILDGTVTDATTLGLPAPTICGYKSIGGGNDMGWVATQDPTGAAVNDNIGGSNTAINSYYETAPIGEEMGRSLFGYCAMKIRGSGTLTPVVEDPAGTQTNLASYTLVAAPLHDAEFKMNKIATDLSIKVGTNAVGAYWSIQRMSIELKRAFSNMRGHNA